MQIPDTVLALPPCMAAHDALRRSFLGGYRVGDVAVMLAQLELALGQARLDLESTERRLLAAEALAEEQRERMEQAQRLEAEATAALRSERERHEAAAAAARARAEAAEFDAATERAEANRLREAYNALGERVRTLAQDIEHPRLEHPGLEHPPHTDPPPRPEPVREPQAPPQPFSTNVELEAGPFEDLASLTAFERSVASLPHVAEVYVRRYESERATIELQLDEPSDLLHDISSQLPYIVQVESADARRLSVTLTPEVAPR